MKQLFTLGIVLMAIALHAQTADEIINKHFEATGGHDKWAKVTSLKYTGTYTIGPGMQAPVTQVVTSKPFTGLYSDFSWQGMTAKTVMQGDSGWSYRPFQGKRETDPLSPNEIRSISLDADPQGLLFNYKEKGYTVDYLGTDDMDGSDVYKLRLQTKNGDMVYYYIDQETYYVLKTETRIRLKDKEEKSYTTYSDFKKTDYGIVLPFSEQNVDADGNEQGGPTNYTKIEVNAAVDASIFDKLKK
ncbi:MAG TPA: hypothetical protein VG603_14480 [Chitinophagales bacterium]|nr:hypothetical protein [Chitinophagales bacterium]